MLTENNQKEICNFFDNVDMYKSEIIMSALDNSFSLHIMLPKDHWQHLDYSSYLQIFDYDNNVSLEINYNEIKDLDISFEEGTIFIITKMYEINFKIVDRIRANGDIVYLENELNHRIF